MSHSLQNAKAAILALAIIAGFAMQTGQSHAATTAETPALQTGQGSHPPCHGV
jgi:hypothetical protein